MLNWSLDVVQLCKALPDTYLQTPPVGPPRAPTPERLRRERRAEELLLGLTVLFSGLKFCAFWLSKRIHTVRHTANKVYAMPIAVPVVTGVVWIDAGGYPPIYVC